MARVTVGDVMPDVVFNTPFQSELKLSDLVGKSEGKTAIAFLRYYGCRLCQYDLYLYEKHYAEIKAVGGNLLVVLQSDPKKLADEFGEVPPPFEIICDPQQRLYKEFEIMPAASKEEMIDASTMKKIGLAAECGFVHGDYEGNELQLPAVFILEKDRTVVYAHYGTTAGDVPGPAELVKLLG